MNKIDKESYQKILEILANKSRDEVEKAIAKFLKEEKKQEENVELTK